MGRSKESVNIPQKHTCQNKKTTKLLVLFCA